MIIGPPPKFHGTRDILAMGRVDFTFEETIPDLLGHILWACQEAGVDFEEVLDHGRSIFAGWQVSPESEGGRRPGA